MTFNLTLPPTVAEFRAAFPEFSGVSDGQIEYYLFIGMQWIDTFWYPIDAKLAVMNVAAHFLWMQNVASGGGLITGSAEGGGGSGTVVDPELGKIWVKSVRFRDRMVSYERVGIPGAQAAGGGGSESAASAEFWQASPYGQMYLSFQRRNVPHIAVI